MRAIILAGGMGTRLRDVVHDVPKPMAPVAGKPFLEYLVRQLASQGIREIILSVGYKAETIIDYFGDGRQWAVSVSYCREDLPLGTGGAVREALKSIPDKSALILNGDTLTDICFEALEATHREKNGLVTIGLVHQDDGGRYGRVEVDGEMAITGFYEKEQGRPGFVNIGAYFVDREVLSLMPAGTFSLEKDLFVPMADHGTGKRRMYGHVVKGVFIDMGVPEDYRRLNDTIDHITGVLKI